MSSHQRKTTKTYNQICPVAKSLDLIGDRWTLLILRDVALLGPRRFGEFKESLTGVPPTLLSNRLKMLVDEEMLQKSGDTRFTTTYSFTERGSQIRPVLAALRDFGVPLISKNQKLKKSSQVFS